MEKLRNTHPTMTYISDELILGARLADGGYELDHSELACKMRKLLGQPDLPKEAPGARTLAGHSALATQVRSSLGPIASRVLAPHIRAVLALALELVVLVVMCASSYAFRTRINRCWRRRSALLERAAARKLQTLRARTCSV